MNRQIDHNIVLRKDFPQNGSCYVGGLSALTYWGLLSTKSQKTSIFCSLDARKAADSLVDNAEIFARKTHSTHGLIKVREATSFLVASPEKAFLDLLRDPKLMKNTDTVISTLKHYLSDQPTKRIERLLMIADDYKIGVVYKRLGFLIELIDKNHLIAIQHCAERMSRGNSYLEQFGRPVCLATKWRLWIPVSYRN